MLTLIDFSTWSLMSAFVDVSTERVKRTKKLISMEKNKDVVCC